MAGPTKTNVFRVKRDKTAPLVFSFELELDDEDEEPDVEEPVDVDNPPVEADPDEEAKPEPVSFESNGKTYPFEEVYLDGDVRVRRYWYRARAKVPGVMMLDLVGAGAGQQGAAELRNFLNKAVYKLDRERFGKMLEESEPPIGMDDLNGMVEFLVERYSGDRPTERPKA